MFASTVFQLVLSAAIVTIIALVGLRWVAAARVQSSAEKGEEGTSAKRRERY